MRYIVRLRTLTDWSVDAPDPVKAQQLAVAERGIQIHTETAAIATYQTPDPDPRREDSRSLV